MNLVQELTGAGTPTANLLVGLSVDETFTRTDASGTSTLLVDALGSTLELADASGTLQTHYTFDPFGATSVSGSSSTATFRIRGAAPTACVQQPERCRSCWAGTHR
jgi:hypothetical protein